MTPPPPAAIARVGTLAVAAYAAMAALQILVLNPLAAAPGRSLAQIHADMDAAGESLGTPTVVVVAGVALAMAITLAVNARREPPSSWRLYLAGYLAILMLGVPAYWVASFGAGMSLADTYGITGGDHSPWALPLYAVSALAFIGLVTLAAAALTGRSAPQSSR